MLIHYALSESFAILFEFKNMLGIVNEGNTMLYDCGLRGFPCSFHKSTHDCHKLKFC